jgi:hypothetical protein
MGRDPFVWEVHVRRELVEDELARLREVPYALWEAILGAPRSKEVVGRDSRTYTIEVGATKDPATGNIEVTATLLSPGWRRAPLWESFVISPRNEFVDE